MALEVAGTDLRRTLLQCAQRPHQRAGEEEAGGDRDQQRDDEDQRGAQQGRIERREGFLARRVDEHGPAQRRDRRVRGEHLRALQVAPVGRRGPRLREGRDLRQRVQVRLLQHQADVGMRDQRAGRVDDVGQSRLADLDLRDHVPDELEVDFGRSHAAAAAGLAGDRHVRLGSLAEVDRPVVRDAGRSPEEFRLGRHVGAAAHRVHRQARDAQLLAPARVDPGHLGDRRRLALQLQVVDAALLERVAALYRRQRRPAHLVLDVDDVLLDPRRRVLGLFFLERDQVIPGLVPREPDADGAARNEHAADQRDDQQRVLRKEAPATHHSTTRPALDRNAGWTARPDVMR